MQQRVCRRLLQCSGHGLICFSVVLMGFSCSNICFCSGVLSFDHTLIPQQPAVTPTAPGLAAEEHGFRPPLHRVVAAEGSNRVQCMLLGVRHCRCGEFLLQLWSTLLFSRKDARLMC
jgi:hypothetical protein